MSQDESMRTNVPDPGVVPRAKRRRFSAEYKLRILSLSGLILIAFILSTVVLPSLQAQGAPPPQQSSTVRFVVTGDTRGSDNGVNTQVLGEIVQATVDEAADFILISGDLVNGYTGPATLESQLTTWQTTMQPLYSAGIGVYPVRGNHDTGSKMAWDNVFSGTYALPDNGPSGEENMTFSFTHGNVFVVGLDQYGTHYHRVNQTWLDAQLTSNTQPHVFVFGHEPAFSVRHESCLDDYPSDRDVFWSSLVASGARVYLTGHDHFYNHARLDDGDGDPNDDLHQLVLGTGGAPLYRWNGSYGGDNGPWTPQLVYHEATYGYVLVEIDGPNATLTWKHRTAPGVWEAGGDVFTYTALIRSFDVVLPIVFKESG